MKTAEKKGKLAILQLITCIYIYIYMYSCCVCVCAFGCQLLLCLNLNHLYGLLLFRKLVVFFWKHLLSCKAEQHKMSTQFRSNEICVDLELVHMSLAWAQSLLLLVQIKWSIFSVFFPIQNLDFFLVLFNLLDGLNFIHAKWKETSQELEILLHSLFDTY